MILVVDSGSTKTDWISVDDSGKTLFATQTLGLNPQVLSSAILKERIINNFDLFQNRKQVTHLYFYGAGCKLRTVLSSQKEIVMVLESAPGGTLRTLLQLRGRKGTFSESQVRFYVAEIVAGVIHLHKRGILHRDLKMENILLNAKGHILIAGFELCLPRPNYFLQFARIF